MEHEFWLEKWQKNETGFHMAKPHHLLVKTVAALPGLSSSSVLVPLCGKTPDISFLADRSEKVTGVELSKKAVEAFFQEHGMQASCQQDGDFSIYRSGNIILYCGDYLAFPEAGAFDFVYDRAALIALPQDMRRAYVEKTARLCRPGTGLVLISLVYDSAGGPPFSITDEEISCLYSPFFEMTREGDFPADVKGARWTEVLWTGIRKS